MSQTSNGINEAWEKL